MRGLTTDEMRIAQSMAGDRVSLYPGPHGPTYVYPPEDQERIALMIERGLMVAVLCQCGFRHPQLTKRGLEAMSLQKATEES